MKNSEQQLVLQLRRLGSAFVPPGASPLRLGIGDDAAIFSPRPGHETILTCDWFLEGTHFLADKHPADSIGWKCLARAVSDIAAMGGVPRCFLLSLALPKNRTGRWLTEFLHGLRRAARRFHCQLAGGDTTRRDEVLLNITVVGELPRGQAVSRSGAKPGDAIFVSGRLGEAELGLYLLRKKHRLKKSDPTLRKHLYPEPRLALGQWLAESRLASAMMDLSDGLSSDLPRLCAASRVGARLNASQLPTPIVIPSQARNLLFSSARFTPLSLALNGGDDYELLFTVHRKSLSRIPSSFHGIPLSRIGEITATRKLLLIDSHGHSSPLHPLGWDSFRTE